MLTAQVSTSFPSWDVNPSPLIPCRKRKLPNSSDEPSESNTKSVSPPTSCPHHIAKEVFVEKGVTVDEEQLKLLSVHFVKPSPAQIAAYCVDTIKAVRAGDVNVLRRMHTNGISFDCCNRYGESLVSMVCRKGNTEIVRFLVKEAKVSLFICDDFGRTVLHDACWTPEPVYDVMELLLEEVPDLLFVKDVRGHTPLDYARKQHWEKWTSFLQDRKHLLRPKLLVTKIC